MADHWRYDPRSPFQIASAQTLARRQWPDADLIVIDEAHADVRVGQQDQADCRRMVIGCRRRHFPMAFGVFFQSVCASSMHALTESGVLVPMRVFSCTKVNMRGAATAGGEWTDGARRWSAAWKSFGDVVANGRNSPADFRKTIVFRWRDDCALRGNGQAVQRGRRGMAVFFTSGDTSEVRALRCHWEYRKPDLYAAGRC